ncbi:MAG: MFS transporter [Candidatus Staskawiczbacteria bacterium]|nr:MFS transporter [Candidatus Staskawiczbacteria bacterium]
MSLKQIFGYILPQKGFNKALRILITVNTVMVFVIGLLAPFYAIFVQKIGGNIAFAGFSWAVFSIVAGVLTLLFGKWQLKVKQQELLLALGYLIRGLVFLSYAFMGSIAQLIFTQVLWGVGAALGTPAFDAVYSAHTSKEDSIVQWGQWEGIAAIAAGLAALVGGILIQEIGYPIVFIGMSFICFLLGIYIWKLPREVL